MSLLSLVKVGHSTMHNIRGSIAEAIQEVRYGLGTLFPTECEV